MKIVISSGHGKHIRGASGYIDEVDEARKVVDKVAERLTALGVGTTVFHDDVSTSQNENLNRIVDFHNSKTRDLDVSVHFNAYETTSKAMGSEVLYVSSSGSEIADDVVDSICGASGLVNRGPKMRSDLFFLNNTEMPAVLIEVCFVDSRADVDLYHANFAEICHAIAVSLMGEEAGTQPPPLIPPVTDADDEAIMEIAVASEIYGYAWKDRGVAPPGYMKGFALAWATVVRNHMAGASHTLEMAKGDTGNEDLDALSWYKVEFSRLGMDNDYAGLTTLRHLFALLLGAGMRESSGRHCEGRDQSAENVASDTAEAGLFQTSYNAHTCSDEFDRVMSNYEDEVDLCYEEAFAEGVSCTASEWSSYGSGEGKHFQDLCKHCPPVALETAALVFRNRRQHYGPINRKEVELRSEADWMLLDVQRYVMRAEA